MKPRIGIVVPIGRFTPALQTTLLSLISQDIDVAIAVYDASNDVRTRKIIEAFREHLSYVHYGDDGGQANAIKMGWNKLDSEIIGWLNDDDHLSPGALSHVIDLIDQNESCSGVYGPSIILNKDGVFSGMHPAVDPNRIEEIFINNIISQPSCFVKHSYVKKIGGIDSSLNYTMDWDLWTRLLKKFPNSFVYSDKILSAVTFASETKTADLSFQRLHEIFNLTKKYNSKRKAIIAVFSFSKWGLGQKFRPNSSNIFFSTSSNTYKYWQYGKNITGFKIFGNFAPADIEIIQKNNDIHIANLNKNKSAAFIFKKTIPSGIVCEICIPDNINHESIVFQISEG